MTQRMPMFSYVRRTPVLTHAVALILTLAAPVYARAQPSTSRVQPTGGRPEIEIAVGRELVKNDPYLGDTCGGCRKAAIAATVAARWALTPVVGVLADATWIQRPGRSYAGASVSDKLLAVGTAVDMRWPVYRAVKIGPSVGAAFVPYASSTRPFVESNGTGVLWTAGLTVRVGRFVLQQHLLLLNGADRVIQDNREYYPLTVGWTL